MNTTELLIQEALSASEDRKAAALRLLRGEVAEPARRATEPFLTLVECARRLNVSACSLWRWGVPGHELGGRRKFRMSEVEAYLGSEAFKQRAAVVRDEDRERREARSAKDGGGIRTEARKGRKGTVQP